jgi:hypothetical protein
MRFLANANRGNYSKPFFHFAAISLWTRWFSDFVTEVRKSKRDIAGIDHEDQWT